MNKHEELMQFIRGVNSIYTPLVLESIATVLEDMNEGIMTKEDAIDEINWWIDDNLEVVRILDAFNKWKDLNKSI